MVSRVLLLGLFAGSLAGCTTSPAELDRFSPLTEDYHRYDKGSILHLKNGQQVRVAGYLFWNTKTLAFVESTLPPNDQTWKVVRLWAGEEVDFVEPAPPKTAFINRSPLRWTPSGWERVKSEP